MYLLLRGGSLFISVQIESYAIDYIQRQAEQAFSIDEMAEELVIFVLHTSTCVVHIMTFCNKKI